jgi:hypothetical protein
MRVQKKSDLNMVGDNEAWENANSSVFTSLQRRASLSDQRDTHRWMPFDKRLFH